MARRKKVTIGRSEYIDLPDWGIYGVLAKVDTGARTSALHVEDIIPMEDGRVLFHVILDRHQPANRLEVCAHVIKRARVRSSSGHFSVRWFVKTKARIGPIEKGIEISLDRRDKMAYRMLLGRRALQKDFLVDVSKRHTLGGLHKDDLERNVE